MHPSKTKEGIVIRWHFYSQFCSKQSPESQLALIPIQILHNVKGLLSRNKMLMDSYQPCLFTSCLQVHLHTFIAPTRFLGP